MEVYFLERVGQGEKGGREGGKMRQEGRLVILVLLIVVLGMETADIIDSRGTI